MNDWMTERVAKTRVKEEVLVSFCRSPEMSQHLAVLLVSFLKVGWSFWTTYNASKQILSKAFNQAQMAEEIIKTLELPLGWRFASWVFPRINMTLAFAAFTSCWGSWNMKNIYEYLTKVPTLQDAAENFSPFCFQEETCPKKICLYRL